MTRAYAGTKVHLGPEGSIAVSKQHRYTPGGRIVHTGVVTIRHNEIEFPVPVEIRNRYVHGNGPGRPIGLGPEGSIAVSEQHRDRRRTSFTWRRANRDEIEVAVSIQIA